jgi:hypothetical protein
VTLILFLATSLAASGRWKHEQVVHVFIGCSSVVEHLPSNAWGPGLIPSTAKNQSKKPQSRPSEVQIYPFWILILLEINSSYCESISELLLRIMSKLWWGKPCGPISPLPILQIEKLVPERESELLNLSGLVSGRSGTRTHTSFQVGGLLPLPAVQSLQKIKYALNYIHYSLHM